MNESIRKVFIVSAGRTGTRFFGEQIQNVIPSSISVHEPDKVNVFDIPDLKLKLKRQNFVELVILKSFGIMGSRNVSLNYLGGRIDRKKAQKKILHERRWVNGVNYYFEANQQLYGLTNVLPSIPNTKVIIIFRDPRQWIRSIINKGNTYTKKDIVGRLNFLGFKRLSPRNLNLINEDWDDYSQFQKVCWIWNYMNSNFYCHINLNDRVKHYFFEGIFVEKDEKILDDFMKFSLDESYRTRYTKELHDLLKKKVNESPMNSFQNWREWPNQYCKDLNEICGDLMRKLGYGKEPEWLEKIK